MPTEVHTRTRIVQSRHNARVKELRAVLSRPSASLIGLEGMHLVEEALRSGLEVPAIFVRLGSESLLDALPPTWLERVPEILALPEEVLNGAVTTDAPQAIAALAVPPVFRLEQVLATPGPALLLVLAGVQDPGNVGTILRSAEAFGAHGVLVLPGTASPWNPKCLRASMGSAFRVPVIALAGQSTRAGSDTAGKVTSESAGRSAIELLREAGVRSLGAVAPGRAATPAHLAEMQGPVALWIGNEGSGLSSAMVGACAGGVTIPCPGPVESLNAASAASVLLYEVSRQRAAAADLGTLSAAKPHPSLA